MALVDVLAGLHAAAAMLAGAFTAEGRAGSRCRCSTALWPASSTWRRARWSPGPEPGRYGNAHPNIVPYQDFATASGRLAVAAPNDGLFRAMCGALGLDELAADERFAIEPGSGGAPRGADPAAGEAACCERRGRGWVQALAAAGVPVGKVRTVPDALAAAAARRSPGHVGVDHPSAGALELVASPIWGGRPATPRRRRPCWASTRRRCWESWDARPRRSQELVERGVVRTEP